MTTTRLELLQHEFPSQYGQSLTPGFAGSGNFLSLAKDLVRWKGKYTDITPLRIYLGPWGLQPQIPTPALSDPTNYAQPTPWLPSNPLADDSFLDVQIFAEVQWGSGGVYHTAYVDWPERGCLFQVSGTYVQVNAIAPAQFISIGPADPRSLPVLSATLALEPGGGDSSAPGTYTYRRQSWGDGGVGNDPGIDFQVPPFARAFIPLLDVEQLDNDAVTGIRVIQKRQPSHNGGVQSNVIYPIATFDPSWLAQPITLCSPLAGVVRLEAVGGTIAVSNAGMQFHLDL